MGREALEISMVAAAELLEAAAGAGQTDGHAYRAALSDLKFFGDRFGDREHRAGAVDANHRRVRWTHAAAGAELSCLPQPASTTVS